MATMVKASPVLAFTRHVSEAAAMGVLGPLATPCPVRIFSATAWFCLPGKGCDMAGPLTTLSNVARDPDVRNIRACGCVPDRSAFARYLENLHTVTNRLGSWHNALQGPNETSAQIWKTLRTFGLDELGSRGICDPRTVRDHTTQRVNASEYDLPTKAAADQYRRAATRMHLQAARLWVNMHASYDGTARPATGTLVSVGSSSLAFTLDDVPLILGRAFRMYLPYVHRQAGLGLAAVRASPDALPAARQVVLRHSRVDPLEAQQAMMFLPDADAGLRASDDEGKLDELMPRLRVLAQMSAAIRDDDTTSVERMWAGLTFATAPATP